ncbi:MAG: hypothetical protein O9340_13070 [Cyclobacteriaceae bacterium]|nr:hypothetical protein [Cyclobacteriaceae bacterium]
MNAKGEDLLPSTKGRTSVTEYSVYDAVVPCPGTCPPTGSDDLN